MSVRFSFGSLRSSRSPSTRSGRAGKEAETQKKLFVLSPVEARTNNRNQEMLRHLPGVQDVGLSLERGLVVVTANPAAVPKTVEGLPIIIYPSRKPPPPAKPPPPLRVPQAPEVLTQQEQPAPVPPSKLLPPPPGVIVLKPGKVRELADKCPEGFNEVEGNSGWRFCVDPQNPQPISPLMAPPIAGIPFEKAQEIHPRHLQELSNLPGVIGVGLGADGIHVTTHNPEVVPKEVEGVPIIVDSAAGMFFEPSSHTYTTPVRPLHGATFIGETAFGGTVGAAATLTGVDQHGRDKAWCFST